MEANITSGLRVGLGEDRHRLVAGGPLRLGGIDIPHDRQLLGHSDADALLHAVTDALLGAAALGDIGELYPDTDPAHRGKDSAEMLTAAWQKVQALGYRLVNLDAVVHAQRPKLSPYKSQIKTRLAELLGVNGEQVSIKAKTGEGVGPVGREEALDVRCVVLLEKRG